MAHICHDSQERLSFIWHCCVGDNIHLYSSQQPELRRDIVTELECQMLILKEAQVKVSKAQISSCSESDEMTSDHHRGRQLVIFFRHSMAIKYRDATIHLLSHSTALPRNT